MARAVDGRSMSGTASADVSRKSLPAPCALVKGICILIPLVNFDYWSAFHFNRLYQMVAGAGSERRFLDGGGHRVARDGDGPLLVQKQVRARGGSHPCGLVAIVQGLMQRDASLAQDSSQVAEAGHDAF